MDEWPRFVEYGYGYAQKPDPGPVRYYIQTSRGTIVVRKTKVQLPIGMHFRERMHHEDSIASERRRTVGVLPGYPVYYMDKGIWYEITFESGKSTPVEEKQMKTSYGEKNAMFFSIGGYDFVIAKGKLWDLRMNEWRSEQNAGPSGQYGFLDIDNHWVEIKVSGVWYRFDSEGYATVESMSDMSKKICKYLVDNKVLLERTTSCVNMLMKDRVSKLSPSRAMWDCLKKDGALTVLHSSQDHALGMITKVVELHIQDDNIRSLCKELGV